MDESTSTKDGHAALDRVSMAINIQGRDVSKEDIVNRIKELRAAVKNEHVELVLANDALTDPAIRNITMFADKASNARSRIVVLEEAITVCEDLLSKTED